MGAGAAGLLLSMVAKMATPLFERGAGIALAFAVLAFVCIARLPAAAGPGPARHRCRSASPPPGGRSGDERRRGHALDAGDELRPPVAVRRRRHQRHPAGDAPAGPSMSTAGCPSSTSPISSPSRRRRRARTSCCRDADRVGGRRHRPAPPWRRWRSSDRPAFSPSGRRGSGSASAMRAGGSRSRTVSFRSPLGLVAASAYVIARTADTSYPAFVDHGADRRDALFHQAASAASPGARGRDRNDRHRLKPGGGLRRALVARSAGG